MAGWQPMETAPRDGTWIILYDDRVMDTVVAAMYGDNPTGSPEEYRWHTLDGVYHEGLFTMWHPMPPGMLEEE